MKVLLLSALLAWTGGERSLTFEDALRMSWQSSSDLAEAELTVESAVGAYRVEGAAFDGQFDFDLTLDHSRLELTPTVYQALVDQRENLEDAVAELNATADDLENQLEESDSRVLTECSDDLIIFIDDQPICNSAGNIDSQLLDDLLLDLLGLDLDLDEALVEELESNSTASLVDARQSALQTIAVLRSAAEDTQESRDLLGDTPLHDETTTLDLALSWSKTYRNGVTLTPALTWTGVETNYAGKEKSSTLGGKGLENTHNTVLSLTWSIPLGEGRGRRIVTASERAAELEVRAAEASSRWALELRTAAVVSAFRSLALAEERMALRAEASQRQDRYAEIGDALIEADLSPEIDARRIDAARTSARRALLSANRERRSARIDLMNAMGVEVPDFEVRTVPMEEEIPSPRGLVQAFREDSVRLMVAKSLERRHDLAAARFRRDAQTLRRDAAADKIRRAIDLELAVGYQGLEEKASISDGFYGALARDVPGASATFQVTVEWPPSTRSERGALVQAEASLDVLNIGLRERERSIGSSLVSLVGRFERAAEEALLAEQAVAIHEQIVRSQIELFQAGEATLRDTLITEDRLTATRLRLLNARFNALELLTQLRLQAGILVDWRDGSPEMATLSSLDGLSPGDLNPDDLNPGDPSLDV